MSKHKAYISMPRNNGERYAKLMVGEFEQMNAMLDNADKSRWFELFGTPEKAAWTVLQLLDCCNTHCEYCGVRTLCDASQVVDGKDGMVEWLRGDA